MSHEPCPCADLLQATDAEKKEAMDRLRAFAKELSRRKLDQAHQALVESEQLLKIMLDEQRAKKNLHRDFALCQRCVVASPEEQVPQPDTQ